MGRETENFYRCKPRRMLNGMVGLDLEEIAVYRTLLDIMYDRWEPLAWWNKEAQRTVFNWLPCAPQKANPIVRRLIDKGRILVISINGRDFLIDEVFAAERAEVKRVSNPLKTAPEVDETSDRSRTEVGQKSDKSTPLLDHVFEENQQHDLRRPEKEQNKTQRGKEKRRKKKSGDGAAREGRDDELVQRWRGNAAIRDRCVAEHGEKWTVSHLDRCEPWEGGVRAWSGVAYDRLAASPALAGIDVHPP